MRIAGCFLKHDSKFVILLRRPDKPKGGTWGLPAGKVEEGEGDREALLRELREETGYTADNSEIEHLGDFVFGQNEKYIFATYKIELNNFYKLKLEKEAHTAYKWVTAEECYAEPDLIPDFHELLKLVGFVK